MGVRAAIVSGTVASLAVTGAWSWTSAFTIGPAAPVHLDRDLPADYARLAGAPTGNGWVLFTVVAVIYALCLLASGWRRRRGGA